MLLILGSPYRGLRRPGLQIPTSEQCSFGLVHGRFCCLSGVGSPVQTLADNARNCAKSAKFKSDVLETLVILMPDLTPLAKIVRTYVILGANYGKITYLPRINQSAPNERRGNRAGKQSSKRVFLESPLSSLPLLWFALKTSEDHSLN